MNETELTPSQLEMKKVLINLINNTDPDSIDASTRRDDGRDKPTTHAETEPDEQRDYHVDVEDYVMIRRAKRKLHIRENIGKRTVLVTGATLVTGTVVASVLTGGDIFSKSGDALGATFAAAGKNLSGLDIAGAEDNPLLENFHPTRYCGDVIASAELDAVAPIYWGINIADSQSEREKAAADATYKPNTAMYYIAPDNAAVPGGRNLLHEQINLTLPEIPFASKEEIDSGEMVLRYPLVGIVNDTDIMICQDNSGGAEPTVGVENGVSVDLSKYSLNALIPDIGQVGAAEDAIMGYDGFEYSNDGNADGLLPEGEVERFNESIIAPDNPNTPKEEDSRDPFVMNALHYEARRAIDKGECKSKIREIGMQAIKDDLNQQAREQGIESELRFSFTGDFVMPADSFDAALKDPALRSPLNAVIDTVEMSKNATCSDMKPVIGVDISDNFNSDKDKGDS